MYKKVIKPVLDRLIALIAIILLSPVMVIVAILVKKNLGGPIIFKQERPGKNGETFYLYKFRSMLNEIDENGNTLSENERVTPFGRKLRSTSLDELPSLFNILKGDLSIVGPRPLLVSYLPLYSPTQARRHEVKPGLTGWAQVNGRNLVAWSKRFELDVYYVDHCSFLLDVKIFFMTIHKVFKREGINDAQGGIVEDFTGDN